MDGYLFSAELIQHYHHFIVSRLERDLKHNKDVMLKVQEVIYLTNERYLQHGQEGTMEDMVEKSINHVLKADNPLFSNYKLSIKMNREKFEERSLNLDCAYASSYLALKDRLDMEYAPLLGHSFKTAKSRSDDMAYTKEMKEKELTVRAEALKKRLEASFFGDEGREAMAKRLFGS